MISTLLIGYDGSDYADRAIADLACAGLATTGHAKVVTGASLWPAVMHEEDPRTLPEPKDPMAWTARSLAIAAMNEAEATSRRGADHVRAVLREWNVTAEASTASPAKALIRHAEETHPDLLVIGPRGRSALVQLVTYVLQGAGSVAHQVIRFAPCSVRIGRTPPDRPAALRPLRLLVGVDGSSESAAAVQSVAMRTWPAGTTVKVVAAVDQTAMNMMLPAMMNRTYNEGPLIDGRLWARQAVDQCAHELQSAGLAAEPIVLTGDPKYVLLREAQSWKADCVFVGAHGLSRFERVMLGSVSASVAEHATCSVEIVRHAGSAY